MEKIYAKLRALSEEISQTMPAGEEKTKALWHIILARMIIKNMEV